MYFKECHGNLKWNQNHACLMLTSFENNLIETTRACTTTDSQTDFCEDKKHSQLKFGRCLICETDNCNGVEYNASSHLCINAAFVMMTVFISVFCY